MTDKRIKDLIPNRVFYLFYLFEIIINVGVLIMAASILIFYTRAHISDFANLPGIYSIGYVIGNIGILLKLSQINWTGIKK